LFLFEKLRETLLGNEVQQLIDFLSVLDPVADGRLHREWNVDHLAAIVHANGQVERDVFFPLLAMTAGFATGAGHGDQTAAEQWAVGDMLYGNGAGMSLPGRALGSGFHGGACLIYETISD
jgi:hypothetical protein